MTNLGSGNHLVDSFENDRGWHYPVTPACEHCDDTHYVTSVHEWILAARECHYMEYVDNAFRRALAECHCILIEGRTECPACTYKGVKIC